MSSSHRLNKRAQLCLKLAVMVGKPTQAPKNRTFRGTSAQRIRTQSPKPPVTPPTQRELEEEDRADGVAE